MTEETKDEADQSWEFNPDYVDKLTGLEEDSKAQSFRYVEAGKRSRRTFREFAKPGVLAQIYCASPSPSPEDITFAIDGMAIGMLQLLGVQLSPWDGFTLSLGWPRDDRSIAQEVWAVSDIGAAEILVPRPNDLPRALKGIQMTLVRDLNETPVDADLLLEPSNE